MLARGAAGHALEHDDPDEHQSTSTEGLASVKHDSVVPAASHWLLLFSLCVCDEGHVAEYHSPQHLSSVPLARTSVTAQASSLPAAVTRSGGTAALEVSE